MIGSSFFALLDDIATLMDDVAAMTKVAAKKTAGVVGDDIAVNAEQVTGSQIDPKRELLIIWAVAKGSLVNKVILVPGGLALSAFAPWLIMPLLMLGGAYLCFEGAEKVIHAFSHKGHDPHEGAAGVTPDKIKDPQVYEQRKIKGAIRTDFVLSAEIIALSLAAVMQADFITQVIALIIIALCITVGVYGLVAGIVKMDDLGLHCLSRKGGDWWSQTMRRFGYGLVNAAPKVMKTLSVVGTAAMFLVGGGILVHGLPPVEHALHSGVHSVAGVVQGASDSVESVLSFAAPALVGLAAGCVLVGAVQLILKIYSKIVP